MQHQFLGQIIFHSDIDIIFLPLVPAVRQITGWFTLVGQSAGQSVYGAFESVRYMLGSFFVVKFFFCVFRLFHAGNFVISPIVKTYKGTYMVDTSIFKSMYFSVR